MCHMLVFASSIVPFIISTCHCHSRSFFNCIYSAAQGGEVLTAGYKYILTFDLKNVLHTGEGTKRNQEHCNEVIFDVSE